MTHKCLQQSKMNLVTRKNWTQQNLKKKEFRSKLLELCKTRIKKSSLDMLNFYLLSAARDMVTDNDSSTTCRRKVQVSIIKNKYKNERPSENMGFI